MSTTHTVFSDAFSARDLGAIFLSDPADDDTKVHAPATLLVTSSLKGLMTMYVETVRNVAETEGLLYQQTGTRIMVDSMHIEQTNRGTLRHMAWRESAPTVFFSPCANAAGANQSTKRKCPACSVQVLINTAYLRAFCFCVLIGTNALESFNGSHLRDDIQTQRLRQKSSRPRAARSHEEVLPRRLPRGSASPACGVRAGGADGTTEASTAHHQRKAQHTTLGAPIFSQGQFAERSDDTLKRKAMRSKQQTRDGALAKAANAATQENLQEAESGYPAVTSTATGKARRKKKGGRGQPEPGATDKWKGNEAIARNTAAVHRERDREGVRTGRRPNRRIERRRERG